MHATLGAQDGQAARVHQRRRYMLGVRSSKLEEDPGAGWGEYDQGDMSDEKVASLKKQGLLPLTNADEAVRAQTVP